jgi:vitamin B12 transporter
MSISHPAPPGRAPAAAAIPVSVPAAAKSSARAALAACCLLAFQAPVEAQPLPSVVVTASRFEEDPRQSLADVAVIDREAIERAGAASTFELLQRHGIEISQSGGRGTIGGIFLRGTKTSQSVVLVDGVRLQNPTAGISNLEFLPLAAVERIEVLRGLSSPLYGTGAIGGVIHVITRRPVGPPAMHGSIGFGSQRTRQATLGYGGALADSGTRFHFGASVDRTDGFDSTAPGSPDYQADRDGNRQSALNLNASQRLAGGWQVGVDLFSTRGSNRYDDSFSTPETAVVDYRSAAASAWLSGNLLPALATQLRVGRTEIDYSYRAFDFAPRTQTRSVAWLNGLDTAAGRFTFGLEQEDQRIAGTGLTTGPFAYGRDRRTIDSVLAGWDREWGAHRFRLQVRQDDIETVGDATSGSAAWSMRLMPDWRLRAGVASAFRAPTFDDLYSPFGANPALEPERARGAEIGLDWERSNGRVGATLFGHRIRNAIELDASFMPTNLNRAEVKGVTIDGRQAFGALALRGLLTVQDLYGERIDPVTGTATAAPLARRARQSGVVGADWRVAAWTLWTDLVFQGDRVDTQGQRLAGYGVWSLGASHAVGRDWLVTARLANAGDRRYQTAFGYESSPRALFVALRYQPR